MSRGYQFGQYEHELEQRGRHATTYMSKGLDTLLYLVEVFFDDSLASTRHGKQVMKVYDLLAGEVGTGGDLLVGVEAKVFGMMCHVLGQGLAEPVLDESDGDPAHDVLGVVCFADFVGIGTACRGEPVQVLGVVRGDLPIQGYACVFELFDLFFDDLSDRADQILDGDWSDDAGRGGLHVLVVSSDEVNERLLEDGTGRETIAEVDPGMRTHGNGLLQGLTTGEKRTFKDLGDSGDLDGTVSFRSMRRV